MNQKNLKNKLLIKTSEEEMYDQIKNDNLKIIKYFLSVDVQYEKNFIKKDIFENKKQISNERISLAKLKAFIELLRSCLYLEDKQFENITQDIVKAHFKNSEILKKEVQAILGDNYNLEIDSNWREENKKIDWKRVRMKKPFDFILLILFFPINWSTLDKKNLNTNHIYYEISFIRTFIIWGLVNYKKIEEGDLGLYKQFIERLERLSWKLYKKCYYFGTEKGTKPKPAIKKTREENPKDGINPKEKEKKQNKKF
jgi:hypothetical protein